MRTAYFRPGPLADNGSPHPLSPLTKARPLTHAKWISTAQARLLVGQVWRLSCFSILSMWQSSAAALDILSSPGEKT